MDKIVCIELDNDIQTNIKKHVSIFYKNIYKMIITYSKNDTSNVIYISSDTDIYNNLMKDISANTPYYELAKHYFKKQLIEKFKFYQIFVSIKETYYNNKNTGFIFDISWHRDTFRQSGTHCIIV